MDACYLIPDLQILYSYTMYHVKFQKFYEIEVKDFTSVVYKYATVWHDPYYLS